MDPSKISSRVAQKRRKRSEAAKARAKAPRKPPVEVPRSVDAAELNLATRITPQVFNFETDEDVRDKWFAVATTRRATKGGKKARKRLGEEVLRVYRRYRAGIGKRLGAVVDADLKHATEMALLCLARGLTPGAVIAYWHEHVGEFTDMDWPPLRFLASAANFDRAEAALARKTSRRRKGPAAGASGMLAAGGLDVRVRPLLEEAGLDLDDWDDRALLGVQEAARARSRGSALHVPRKLKPLVDVVAPLFEEGSDG